MQTDNTYRVALFGHKDFCEHRMLDKVLYELLSEVIRNNPFIEIYVGRNGEFDIYVATIVKRLQKSIGKANNEFICVLPYASKDMEYYKEYYDSVFIPECAESAHPKAAISKRNRWIIEHTDLLICFVKRKKGGAYTAMKYAEKLKKEIINLAQT